MRRVIEGAIQYAFNNCGAKEGDILTSDQKNLVLKLVSEKMTPYIKHTIGEDKIDSLMEHLCRII